MGAAAAYCSSSSSSSSPQHCQATMPLALQNGGVCRCCSPARARGAPSAGWPCPSSPACPAAAGCPACVAGKVRHLRQRGPTQTNSACPARAASGVGRCRCSCAPLLPSQDVHTHAGTSAPSIRWKSSGSSCATTRPAEVVQHKAELSSGRWPAEHWCHGRTPQLGCHQQHPDKTTGVAA